MPKKRIYKHYKKGKKKGGQRYWTGRMLKNYGSQIIRQKIRKDLPLLSDEKIAHIRQEKKIKEKIFPSTHRREEIIRTFEKNPELYKEFREARKPSILFYEGNVTKSSPLKDLILISDKNSREEPLYDRFVGLERTYGIEPNIRHELRHASNFFTDQFGYAFSSPSVKESSALAAEYISARRYKVPERMINKSFREVFKNE